MAKSLNGDIFVIGKPKKTRQAMGSIQKLPMAEKSTEVKGRDRR